MIPPIAPVVIALRIPGLWAHPGELIERLPADCHVADGKLVLADGTAAELGGMAADAQFAAIFRSSCREPARDEELAVVDNYTVNVTLSGPGGSLAAAHAMMRAAAAVMRAGGAGAFIDNSGLAHGAQQWLDMSDDGSSDALSFAYVSIIRGQADVWTMGMHVLGLRDVVMKRADAEAEGTDIVAILRYLARGEKEFEEGHLIADLEGPRFQAIADAGPKGLAGTPMHNPFGRLRLVSMRDIAENN